MRTRKAMRKLLSLALALVMLLALLPIEARAAGKTASEIVTQIKSTYTTTKSKAGVSSFNGWCGAYVNWQLVVLGINTSYISGDGNKEYDNYKNKTTSSGGYKIEAYPASNYSLKSALNAITANGSKTAYNILIGFEKGSGSDGALYGHTCFIHAVINGTVYFSESFSATIGGTKYSEGSPISCSISTFASFYDSWTVLDGVIHFRSAADSVTGSDIVAYAENYLGVPYVSAGKDPSIGFDCGGFVWYVCKHFGIDLGSINLATQSKHGTVISFNTSSYSEAIKNLLPGDLVFFDYIGSTGQKEDHVAIYVGNGAVIHAASSSVRETPLNQSGWPYPSDSYRLYQHICGVRRVVDLATGGGSSSSGTLPVNPDISSDMTLLYQTSYTGVNVDRGTNALVVYKNSGSTVNTNEYGQEVAVNSSGQVTSTRAYGNQSKLTVPSGGFVLSGQHGWDSSAGEPTGGTLFVGKIMSLNFCRVVVDFDTGKVLVYGYANDEFSYKLDSSGNGDAIITNYSGNADSLTIPSSIGGRPVKTLGGFAYNHAFGDNATLTTVKIGDGVSIIDSYAFTYCSSLSTIYIPSSITSIKYNAFKHCNSLTDVFFNGTQEEWNRITIGNGNECLTNATIHCASGPLTISSVTANKTSAKVGDTITWTAIASGGTGTLKYDFFIIKDGTLVIKSPRGAAASYSYTPTAAGTYTAKVNVRDEFITVNKESNSVSVAAAVDPLTINSITANKTSVKVDEPITWTASASGGSGTLQYSFCVYKDGNLVAQSSYGTGKTYTYTPTTAGSYTLRVYVKDSESISINALNKETVWASAPSSTMILVGDVNGDGSVTNADAAFLKRYVAGWSVNIDRNAADLNRDGSVTNADAALLNRYIAGWEGYDSYIIEVPASP